MRFFLNTSERSYLRGLEADFGESTNAIRLELNRFEEAGLLVSSMDKNKKMYQANRRHPLFDDINSIIRKTVGLDQLIDKVVTKLGNVTKAYIIGEIAKGIDFPIINVILVGNNIDKSYLETLIDKAETFINRGVKCLVVPCDNAKESLTHYPEAFLIWEKK